MDLPFTHAMRLRVGYAETDQMAVAHHAAHLVWFERARIELLRALGASYAEMERRGVILPVREARVRYRHPARFDDELEIEATLARISGASCLFQYGVRRISDNAEIADGEIELVFCDTHGRPMRHGARLLREMAREIPEEGAGQ